jgi:hypothetical protein
MQVDVINISTRSKLHRNFNKKVAVLFRGPVRPNAATVAVNTALLIDELRFNGFNVSSYLATWSDYNSDEVNKLLSRGLYDNVILQKMPTKEHIKKYVTRDTYGIYPISNVYNMYYQSETAIDFIIQSDNYDYIVHSRTDLRIRFGKQIHDWFSQQYYVMSTNNTPWICDWIGIATPEIMQKAWNFKDRYQLGELIDNTNVPEYVAMMIMKYHNISTRTNTAEEIWLDPNRNQ